jgi:hypothetical protein
VIVSAIASYDEEVQDWLGLMHVAADMGKSLPVQTAGATCDD